MRRRDKGTGHLFTKNGIYYWRRVVSGKPIEKSLRTRNKKEAEAKVTTLAPIADSKTKEDLALQVAKARKLAKGSTALLAEGWGLFLKSQRRPDSGDRTLSFYESYWTRFKAWLLKEMPGVLRIGQVDSGVAEKYMIHIGESGISARTFNGYLQALGLIFKILAADGHTEENPFAGVRKRTEEKESREELSEDEVFKVLKVFDDETFYIPHREEMRVLFHLGPWTGMRLQDCVRLKWSSIKWTTAMSKGTVAAVPAKTARKTGKPVLLIMHPCLENALRMAEAWRDESGFILPSLAQRFKTNWSGISKDCTKVFEKAGFETSKKADGKRRKLATCQYSFHSFRHSFVSFCANAGVPLHQVAQVVGHGNPAMTRHYAHPDKKTLEKITEALPGGTTALLTSGTESKREGLIKAIYERLAVLDEATLEKLASLTAARFTNQ